MNDLTDQPSLYTLYKFCVQNIQNEASILLGPNLYSTDSRYPGVLCVAINDTYVENNKYCERLADYWCRLNANPKYRYTVNQKKNFIQKQASKWLGTVNYIHKLNKAPNAATKFSLIKLNHVVEYKRSDYSTTKKLGTVLVQNEHTGKTFVSLYACDQYRGWYQTDFKTLAQVYVTRKPVEIEFEFLAKYAPKVLADTIVEKAHFFNNNHSEHSYSSERAVSDYYKLLHIELPPIVLEMVSDMKLSFTDARAWIEASQSDEFKNSDVPTPEFEF